MRYKVVPPVRDLDFLYRASDALPLVPDSVEDCCTRIRDHTDLPSRDAAREVLTFLEALGLAAEAERGYHRVRDPPDRDVVETGFCERIFGVDELRTTLASADGSITAAEAFEALRETVPRWERDRHQGWEDVWRERVRRLLEWGVAFGCFQATGNGYRLAPE